MKKLIISSVLLLLSVFIVWESSVYFGADSSAVVKAGVVILVVWFLATFADGITYTSTGYNRLMTILCMVPVISIVFAVFSLFIEMTHDEKFLAVSITVSLGVTMLGSLARGFLDEEYDKTSQQARRTQ